MLDARAGARPLTYVNAAFEGFFGYRADEALGRPLAALLFHGDEPLVHRLLAESSSRWKLRAWGKDGAVRHVELSLGAVHSADGQLTHWVVAFADRSEIEKLRAELEGLKALAAAP
jgi:PAS domain S-box-containing protein